MQKQFKHKSESNIMLSQLMLPSHSNFNGKVHGGYILAMMDQIAFACASKHSGEYCVTASVNTVNFLRPVEVGELLTLKASINYVGRSSMVVGIRVEAENVRNHVHEKKHCNSSYFTMIAIDGEGNTTQVPGLILENQNDIRRFSKSIARQNMEKFRHKEFSQEDFISEKYVELIKGFNVKLLKTETL